MPTKKSRTIIIGAAMAVVTAGCGSNGDAGSDSGSEDSSESFVWRWDQGLGTVGSNQLYMYTEWLPEEIDKATDGRVTIEPVIGQTSPADVVRNVEQGLFDGGTVTVAAGPLGTTSVASVSSVGFLFDDAEAYERAYRGETEFDSRIIEIVEEQTGLDIVGGLWMPSENLIFSNKPLESMDDFQGLRLRGFGPETAAWASCVGAAPTTIPFAEVYSSLERGVLDAIQTDVDSAETLKIWEITSHVTRWNEAYTSTGAVLNPDSLAALPDDLQESVMEVFDRLEDAGWERRDAQLEEKLQLFEDNDMTIVDPSDDARADAIEKCRPVVTENWLAQVGDQGEEIVELAEAVNEDG
jgi:TRAP-type C4-dicarboxylate transport system substrate-binding protein